MKFDKEGTISSVLQSYLKFLLFSDFHCSKINLLCGNTDATIRTLANHF